jgi:hypothetical protein
LWVHGVGVLGPGLPGWRASEPILAGAQPWAMAEAVPPAPELLSPASGAAPGSPPASRSPPRPRPRRTSPTEPRWKRSSPAGNGDGSVVGSMLEALHVPDGAITPTQFHNSVHNAAAGYWHIAVASTRPGEPGRA